MRIKSLEKSPADFLLLLYRVLRLRTDDGKLTEARRATLEERLAYLEGMDEHSHRFGDLRDDIRRLDDRISRQFVWTVGIQLTTFVALLSAILARP